MAIQASRTNYMAEYSMDKFRGPGPVSLSIRNEERISILQNNFVSLAFSGLTDALAVSLLRSCDPHLATLVFCSHGYAGYTFSTLVLGEYSKLCKIPGFELGDSTEDNFGKDRDARLLAINAVFQKFLKLPRLTSPGSPELSAPHAAYDIVKSNFSQQLMLDPSTASLLQRASSPPKSSLTTPRSIAQEAEAIRQATDSDSPEASQARRAFVLKGFEARLSPVSPPRAAESPPKEIPSAESPEDLVPPKEEIPLPVRTETTAPASPTEKVTPKPRVVITPAAVKAVAAATKRTIEVKPGGNIICTIRK